MVLSLKPFGCMPSTQSDGVQSAVAATVQGHAVPADRDGGRGRAERAQPRADGARRGAGARRRRSSTARSRRPGSSWTTSAATSTSTRSCASPFHHVPHRAGVAGVAANFVLHVGRADRSGPRLARRRASSRRAACARPPTSRCHERVRTPIPPRPRRRFDDRQGRRGRRADRATSSGRTTSGTRAGPAEKLLELLTRLEQETGVGRGTARAFITGRRGRGLAPSWSARATSRRWPRSRWPSSSATPTRARSSSWAARTRRSSSSKRRSTGGRARSCR